jgi:hypothetical protein
MRCGARVAHMSREGVIEGIAVEVMRVQREVCLHRRSEVTRWFDQAWLLTTQGTKVDRQAGPPFSYARVASARTCDRTFLIWIRTAHSLRVPQICSRKGQRC